MPLFDVADFLRTAAKRLFTEAAVWRILKRYCPEIAATCRRKILASA